MKFRKGMGWWIAALIYVAVCTSIIHLYLHPFPLRVNSSLINHR